MSSGCAQAETHSTATSSQRAWQGPTTKAPRLAPPRLQEPVPLETEVKEGRYPNGLNVIPSKATHCWTEWMVKRKVPSGRGWLWKTYLNVQCMSQKREFS